MHNLTALASLSSLAIEGNPVALRPHSREVSTSTRENARFHSFTTHAHTVSSSKGVYHTRKRSVSQLYHTYTHRLVLKRVKKHRFNTEVHNLLLSSLAIERNPIALRPHSREVPAPRGALFLMSEVPLSP